MFAIRRPRLATACCLLVSTRLARGAERKGLSTFVETTKFTQNPQPALRHDSILSTIGSTPLVKLRRLSPSGVDIYVKAEAFNPMGSVKDRLALGMIEYAEQHGHLKPGQTVVEATSGNTGLGLAMVCAAKGYPFVCIMSEAFSIERRKMMRFMGAKCILTNPAHKFGGMLQTLIALKEQHGWYWPNQFENEANAWIHRQTTGCAARSRPRDLCTTVCPFHDLAALIQRSREIWRHRREIVEAMEGVSSFDWFVCACTCAAPPTWD